MLSKLKRRFYQYLILFRPLIYLLIFGLLLGLMVLVLPRLGRFASRIITGPNLVVSLLNPAINQLDSFRGRTNLLLLGIAGGDHPGADLTDSIMLASINLASSDTVLVSLPRDIWVESLAAKLNTAYHYGESQEPGGGLILAKSAVSEIINQPIHYALLIDFSGFAKAIDAVGGLDLDVPRGFIDEKYPVPGKESVEPETDRYEFLQFFPGQQHMDGSTALKYVRSRYAQGEEGTDYARAQRQQRVILAFKDKVFSPRILLNPVKLRLLYKTVRLAVKTDIPSSAYPDLLKLSLRVKPASLRTGIIDQGSLNEEIPPLLYSPPSSVYGQWVLLPVDNNWQAVYDHIEEILYQNQ